MNLLTQLGGLLLSSVPTIFCLLILWVAYRNIVQKKLERVLAERHSRTEGAIEQAQLEIASAEKRTAEYEQKLRDARALLYQRQEARRKLMMQRRDEALAEARLKAGETVKESRNALAKDVAAARANLQQQVETLAAQVIDSILKPAAAMGGR
ncbi:MAG TPA: ATP synthase F0 subunit B [Candidatus Angelobacter sp.]|nr:ATP synthase F0 subunit B [Candidatus Angelobacter sp.]